jgi:PAS domain S-box-containing protein
MRTAIKVQAPAVHHSDGSKPGHGTLNVVLGVALIASAALLLLLYDLPRQQRTASGRVDHTLEVLNVATSLDADLAVTISEARGFIIDQRADSRGRFEAATVRVSGEVSSLRHLTSDNPVQQSTLGRIEPMIVARVGLLRDLIEALNGGEAFSSLRIISARLAGQALTEQIAAAADTLKAEERRLLVERRATARRIVRLWLGVSLACGIMAAAGGFFAVGLLVVRTRKGEHVAELRQLNAGLEARVKARNAELSASEAGFRLLAEDLQVSEARYRLLAECTNDLIICTHLDFRRTYASPASRAILGYEPEEILRDGTSAALHPDDAVAVHAAVHPLTVGETERTLVTYRAQHKAGHWVWVEVTVSLVRDQGTGEPASLVCSMRDISERHAHADELHSSNARLEHLARHLVKARDTAERASRAKSRFLAGMSHELRTPLNGILGYAQLLRMEGGLNDAQAARVDAMLDAGKHLLEMIHCVLDMSEIEVERFALQPADFDLHRLAGACLDLVRPTAEAKPLVLSLSIAPGVPVQVRTDPTRLRQVLLNLLGNAVKFTARGSVELRVLTTPDGGELRCEVVDTGPGIPLEQRRRLFQDFERLDTDATRTGEGAGLGLSIAAQLAALMGGRIGHVHNPAGGSVFWLELPLVTSTKAMPLAFPAPVEDVAIAEPAPRSERVLNVLVVDDIAMNRDIASSFLRVAGHQVTCVEGGREAIVAVSATDFDVVLMDVRMPEMDGLEATRRIRMLKGARGRVPIVALTAQAFADQVTECRDAGMNSHLAKPFDADSLLVAVVRATAAEPMPVTPVIRSIMTMSGTIPGPGTIPSSGTIPLVTPSGDPELLVFDLTAFERTARFLAPEAVSSYFRDIAERGEALLRGLNGPDALGDVGTELAEAAHGLAGSAGMFGFARLASAGRHFERAVQTDAVETPELAARLRVTLEATLQVIRDRASVAVPA